MGPAACPEGLPGWAEGRGFQGRSGGRFQLDWATLCLSQVHRQSRSQARRAKRLFRLMDEEPGPQR